MAKPRETRRNVKSTKSASRQPGIIDKAVDAAYKKAGPAGQAAAVLVGPSPTPSPTFDK